MRTVFFSNSFASLLSQAFADLRDSALCLIENSAEINELVKMIDLDLAERCLCQVGNRLCTAEIAAMGIAYKYINDARGLPAIKTTEALVNLGADVRIYDPHVVSLAMKAVMVNSARSMGKTLARADCAIFLVDHDGFQETSAAMMSILIASPVVVRGKNPLRAEKGSCMWGLGNVVDYYAS